MKNKTTREELQRSIARTVRNLRHALLLAEDAADGGELEIAAEHVVGSIREARADMTVLRVAAKTLE